MNRTILAVIVLAVIVGIAGFMFYDGTANESDTVIEKADQTTTVPPAPAK
ncbi:hypothetical protein IZ6_24500 [Terrihabitans soli]|uniref:Uncharacterized protein n=1 Tax=Terrihabitans soli TaxID=708113 RepID=A0A6S6QVW4_9HYPH|nr:hypothetical protein [Terrihabitans soli]BCJ91715.1 hypothetical protein IZ6_24500 [Terrihabitans soli]